MSDPSASFALKRISDHEIHIFYRVDGLQSSTGPSLVLSDLAGGTGLCIPEDQKAALGARYGAEFIWKQELQPELGEDFHAHIRQILAGQRADLATTWVLSGIAQRFVDSASLYEESFDPKHRIRKCLALQLSQAAKDRLAEYGVRSDLLIVHILALTLTLFKTGHGFVTAIIEFARLDKAHITAAELLEAHVAVARLNEIFWIDASGHREVLGAAFTLGQLIRRLALGDTSKTLISGRVGTYAYVQFADASSIHERDLYAVHLARHYTTDYLIAANVGGVRFVADFDTVRHAVALEGAATTVGVSSEESPLPDFLSGFKTATWRRHYVPIALLAWHEHAFLVQRTSASIISEAEMKDQEKTIKKLTHLKQDSLIFRLCYSFSELSYLTMHNALNRAFREVCGLDTMLERLSSDLIEIEAHLSDVKEAEEQRREHEKHTRYYWASITAGAALAGLTTYTIVKEIGELAFREPVIAGWSGAVVGILVSLIAAFIGYHKGPTRDREHDLTLHATLDQMIERALK
jgi:hypothetical protein